MPVLLWKLIVVHILVYLSLPVETFLSDSKVLVVPARISQPNLLTGLSLSQNIFEPAMEDIGSSVLFFNRAGKCQTT